MNATLKAIHYNLNLQFPNKVQDNATQTNVYIEYLMNKFIADYKDTFREKIFVLEYQDDLLSLITLRLLRNIKTVLDIDLRIYGRKVKTKKYFSKEDSFLKKKQFKKYLSQPENKVFISCYNPYYKVVGIKREFNDFSKLENLNLVVSFTPQMINEASNFYFLKDFRDKELEGKEELYDRYRNICAGNKENLKFDIPQTIDTVRLVRLTDDEQTNIDVLSKIHSYNQPFFYFYDIPLALSENNMLAYDFSLENKTNTIAPEYGNVNNPILAAGIIKKYKPYICYDGKWTDKQKKEITDLV